MFKVDKSYGRNKQNSKRGMEVMGRGGHVDELNRMNWLASLRRWPLYRDVLGVRA